MASRLQAGWLEF